MVFRNNAMKYIVTLCIRSGEISVQRRDLNFIHRYLRPPIRPLCLWNLQNFFIFRGCKRGFLFSAKYVLFAGCSVFCLISSKIAVNSTKFAIFGRKRSFLIAKNKSNFQRNFAYIARIQRL